jgi:hypothetical protein
MKKIEKTGNGWYDKQVIDFEANRYGAMTLMMTLQSCWGSVAAMFGLMNGSYVVLGIAAVITLASNAVFIAQMPAKWCLNTFYLSVAVNSLLLVTSLILA